MFRIESLLSARLFLSPQLVGQRIYFISNLGGRLSLYAMDEGGSVPEPLLPPNIALQNPDLIDGHSFQVFPDLGKILIMLDQDGDENYQPMLLPLDGGFPEPVFAEELANTRVHLAFAKPDDNLAYFSVESRSAETMTSYQANLVTGEMVKLAESKWGAYPVAAAQDHQQVVIFDSYTMGDAAVYLWNKQNGKLNLLYGVPIEQREPGQQVPLSGIQALEFDSDGRGLLGVAALFTDTYGPVYLDLSNPQAGFVEVRMEGAVHKGVGEMVGLRHLDGTRFAAAFNIDGCSWLYEAAFDRSAMTLHLNCAVAGAQQPLTNGVMESYDYDKSSDRFIVSFSTATSPTQIYTVAGPNRSQVTAHTRERVMGIAPELLSSGEDASFVSFDGTRISARLYMPAESLGFTGKRPLVYYIHGGPQGQERPDFAWFSMPLIQYLTLNGFAVLFPMYAAALAMGWITPSRWTVTGAVRTAWTMCTH
jgi:hypothetical protein